MKKRKNRTIYLFRHGQTTYNRDKRFTGSKDAKLTAKGKQHARTIAKKMKNKKFHVAIHTSLSRSKDTLKPTLEQHPECVIIIQDDRMTERSYGTLAGKLHKTIIQKKGQKQYDKWHRGYNDKPPKGESFKDVEKRIKPFIKDLKAFIKKHNVNVAISAHGNSIRLFRKIIEKATIKQSCNWNIPYDKIYEYKI